MGSYLNVHKCSAVYRAELFFAMLTKDDFEIVRGGATLGFVLNFYQSCMNTAEYCFVEI